MTNAQRDIDAARMAARGFIGMIRAGQTPDPAALLRNQSPIAVVGALAIEIGEHFARFSHDPDLNHGDYRRVAAAAVHAAEGSIDGIRGIVNEADQLGRTAHLTLAAIQSVAAGMAATPEGLAALRGNVIELAALEEQENDSNE